MTDNSKQIAELYKKLNEAARHGASDEAKKIMKQIRQLEKQK